MDEAIRLQEAAGLNVVTDGELRRYTFYGHLIDSLDGFDRLGGWTGQFRNERGETATVRRPVAVEKLRWRRSLCAEEFTYLRAHARRPVKVTLIGAQNTAAFYDPDKSGRAYPTRDAYLADIVDILRREVTEVVRLGCTYIQIDGPHYAAALDPVFREGYRQRGSDPDQLTHAALAPRCL